MRTSEIRLASSATSQTHINEPTEGGVDPVWKDLYKVGGAAALIMALLMPIQIMVFIIWPPPGFTPSVSNITSWFTLFHQNRLVGLLDLDLLMIVDEVLAIPIFLALYAALRRIDRAYMLTATALGLASIVAFFAANPAFSMLSLSDQYAVAPTDAQRSMVLAAGQVVLAIYQGTAFQVFYILGSIALIIVSVVMLRSQIFSKTTAYVGIVANVIALGLYVPTIGVLLSVLSVVVLEGWNLLLARRLFQLAAQAEVDLR